jgi:hypothetical protein
MQATRQVQQPLQHVEGAARKAAPPPPRQCGGLGVLGRDGKRGRFVEVLGEERGGEVGIGTRGRGVVDDGLRRAVLRAAVGRPDELDVRGVKGEEGGGDPDSDGAGEQHGEEVEERDEEEADVAHEPGALDLDGASSGPGRGGDDGDDAGDDGRHEERAAEDAAEPDVPGVGVGRREGDDAGEHVGRAVAQRQERDARDGRREAQRGGQALERGAEVLGRGVTEEVEEEQQPERERGGPEPRRAAEGAVEEAQVVHVPARRARRVRGPRQVPAPRRVVRQRPQLRLAAPAGLRGRRRRRPQLRLAAPAHAGAVVPRDGDGEEGEQEGGGGGGIAPALVELAQGRHGGGQ